jgi:hypothetical protein
MANKGKNSCQINVLVVIINCIGFFLKLEYINHVGEVISFCPASNTASGPDPIQVSHSPSVYILPKFDSVAYIILVMMDGYHMDVVSRVHQPFSFLDDGSVR